jgi:hypothetical protein
LAAPLEVTTPADAASLFEKNSMPQAKAKQEFIDALLAVLGARSPSVSLRSRLAVARAEAKSIMTDADYQEAVDAAFALNGPV